MVEDAIFSLKKNIESICRRIERPTDDVKIVYVTKTIAPNIIHEAYGCGIRDFGENKVQEYLGKVDILPADIQWHLIGHLQTNKVKYIGDNVVLVHSVDSVKLAREIEKAAVKQHRTIDILLQVNTSREKSKFGIDPDCVRDVLSEVARLPHISVRGLMTIGPLTDDRTTIRQSFRLLRTIRDTLAEGSGSPLTYLSMGMSHDYDIALEEGANILRIGSAVFGERP